MEKACFGSLSGSGRVPCATRCHPPSMARRLRIEYPGALYHITSRGSAREDIFFDEKDRQRLLATLAARGIVNIDPKAQTAIVKVNDKQYLGRFDYAKYEGTYKSVAELKVGEKTVAVGVVVDGYNWITRVADASKLPVPVKEGVAPR